MFCTRDYVRQITYYANIDFIQYSGGVVPNMLNIYVTFDYPVYLLNPTPRLNHCTDFHAVWL